VSKCKLWNPSRIFSNVDLQGYTLVIDDLRILGVQMGFENFVTYFLDEFLFQNMAHINDFLLLENTQVALGSLFSCVVHQLSFLIQIVLPFFLFFFFW
jgi:hypothetical protein